ncbi:MAG: VOC family protein [Melioribacteraceae bacterium]|nr:VOC family protein [Melioribacteraceae bacterium]
MTNPVNWFEIPVSDMEKAKKFYESVFDFELSINEMGNTLMAWFPMEQDATGATGTLIKHDSYIPSQAGTMIYFSVEDIEAILEKVKNNGGEVTNPKTSIGQYGFVGHFADTEGNRIGLHSKQ